MKKLIVILGMLLICGVFAMAQDASVASTDDLFAGIDGVALTTEEAAMVDGGSDSIGYEDALDEDFDKIGSAAGGGIGTSGWSRCNQKYSLRLIHVQAKAAGKVSTVASTGRKIATNLTEKLAMEQAISNPAVGRVLPTVMNDARNGWFAAAGWVKMSRNINGVEIHYIRNTITGIVTDFKFK